MNQSVSTRKKKRANWNHWKVRHGHSIGKGQSATYSVWAAMKQRCLNPNHPHYKDWGGRGITVCERWLSFDNFLADMGEKPPKMQIDRIDNDGNYEPENCRWASPKQQLLNTRRTRLVTFNGQTKALSEWADELGINRSTLYKRINRSGWTPEDALATEVHRHESVN